jgi:prepilin-type N-terminal cleavage/methylation domain-containing protein
METTANNPRNGRPGRGGFTLIEILIVVAILAVLAAIVFGMNITAGDQRQALTASRMLCSDLEYAQSHAIAHRRKVYGTYSTAENSYEYRDSDGNLIELPEGGSFQVRFGETAGADLAQLESVWIADGQPFHFDETGTPSSDAKFTIECGKYSLVVEVVSATGRVLVHGDS